MEKLKPCPFCLGEALIMPFQGGYYVTCGKCGAQTIIQSKEQDAVSLWNRRLTVAEVKKRERSNNGQT